MGAAETPTTAFGYFRRLGRVRRYVDANLEERLSLARVAAVAGMHPAAFSRFFRVSVGLRFCDWLARRRIERARELIASDNLPISQVAVSVGFEHERSFRRAFRRIEGRSPSEFRDAVRRGLRAASGDRSPEPVKQGPRVANPGPPPAGAATHTSGHVHH